jgi:CTP:molybdopterin cytidylyltransferase MocA/2-polyprenyl-3-methyl-5-hydroxy-6-metoxy-1,4-benzoquinol methylase
MTAPRVGAIVLAAGAGSRFGGSKLAARLDGRPILQHVLDRLAEAGIDDPVVVTAVPIADIEWRAARPMTNPDPARGLASSLRIGWDAAMETPEPPDALIVALGDQPLVRIDVLTALMTAPLDPDRPALAPRYQGSGARNPVRLERAAAALVEAATGDHGLGPVLDARPELVRHLDVDGDIPDVDTRQDLAEVAARSWADRVRGNREQVDRLRETPDGLDFYASVSSIFRDDPDRTGDPVLDALRARARPGDTWLDIGAGAGRYALPLARVVREVIALDPSPSMLDALREIATEHGIGNVVPVQARWPDVLQEDRDLGARLPADVTLIAHVGYDVEAIVPFIEAMERATKRECLAVLMERSPASLAEPFWPPIHGEARIALPALPAFVDLLAARGREPEVTTLESTRRRLGSRDQVEGFVRRQTWTAPGSEKDRRMQELIDEWLVETDDGGVDLTIAHPLTVGLVAWRPA